MLKIKIKRLLGNKEKSIKSINYSLINSFLGKMFIASTKLGICYLVFEEEIQKNINYLKNKYPNAKLINKEDKFQVDVREYLINQKANAETSSICLHLVGTEFQLKVWENLLKIPLAETTFYSKIASDIKNLKASRAVGSAIGKNPIAFIIPCHRVVRKNKKIGGYRWGMEKKQEILNWEKTLI